MKKRILILCDGTWNDLEMRYITNVGWLAQLLQAEGKTKSGSKIPQLIYYDDGVAAHDEGLQRFINGAFGGGLERNIYEAYRFLVFNYQRGDEVCLFGFSRGAYTVRSLAGMIERVGLAKKSRMKDIPQAMKAYRGDSDQQKAFKQKTGSESIPVKLLACWDTVGARGMPDKIPWLSIDEWMKKQYEFHNLMPGTCVENGLHAVAMHEKRKEFTQTPMRSNPDRLDQTIVERWFPGDHGCVGGGSWEKRGLSNRCLKWMIQQSKACGVDLGIDSKKLDKTHPSDASIYFYHEVKLPYSKRNRTLPKNLDSFDISAIQRTIEGGRETPSIKKLVDASPNAANELKLRNPLKKKTHLPVGATADFQIQSSLKRQKSRVEVHEGERYEFEASPCQVWKDGGFDPCSPLGWNLSEKSELLHPWVKGKPADVNFVNSVLIRGASSKKLVKEASWFEWVVSVDGENFLKLNTDGGTKNQPYRATLDIVKKGTLEFAANDLASRWGFIDKYDNNRGWIWVRIRRIS